MSDKLSRMKTEKFSSRSDLLEYFPVFIRDQSGRSVEVCRDIESWQKRKIIVKMDRLC